MTTPAEWTAPEGAVWVCGACGKHGPQRDRVGDESCFMHAVLCKADSLILGPDGRAKGATAWRVSNSANT